MPGGAEDGAGIMVMANGHSGISNNHYSEQQHAQQLGRVGPNKLIHQLEYVRLLEQALYKLGYDGVAKQLERDSGIEMQPPHATKFQQCLLAGDWEGTLNLLPMLTSNEEVSKDVRFLVLQQKYLECLEAGNSEAALGCLRLELAPLGVHQQQLHHLAGLLLCPAAPDLALRAGWLGGGCSQRQQVMAQVQQALQAPGVMLPEARLEVLIEQALVAQVTRCPFHNGVSEASLSLLRDYHAGAESLPSKCVQVLDAHSDEVWHVAFSHSGTMLASASKDKTVILWSVRPQLPPNMIKKRRPSPHQPPQQTQPHNPFAPPQSAHSQPQPPPTLPIFPNPFAPARSPPNFGASSTFAHTPPTPRTAGSTSTPTPSAPSLAPQTAATPAGGSTAAAAAAAAAVSSPIPYWLARHPSQQQQQQQQQQPQGSEPEVQATVLHPEAVLRGHEHSVAFVSWSPDDQLLLTVSEEVVRLWQASSGRLLHTFMHHRESVSCCAWMPDSKTFLSGSVDKAIVMSDARGHELQRWKRPYRVQDMAVTHNGALLIIATHSGQIRILRLADGKEVTLQEDGSITSISLSPDSHFLLIALQNHILRLWRLGDLAARCSPQALSKDKAAEDPLDTLVPISSVAEYHVSGNLLGQPGRYVLRSAFGGSHASFVVHGSEECQVYLWHRDSGELLLQLQGHTATINACSWNPTNPHMLVSCSDDHTIRVWMSEASLSASSS